MTLQILGVFAEFEHATIVDRVSAGIERRTKQGYWPNGRVPLGYRRDQDKQLVPDERTAATSSASSSYVSGRLGAAAIAWRLASEHAHSPLRGRPPAWCCGSSKTSPT
jgi:site-specific DNA recombinase